MISRSSVIVNHRVALPGTKAHGAVASHRLDYIRTRPGAVDEATDDDLRRRQAREREDALGYISHRSGAVADAGAICSSTAGGCALFDASGAVADYAEVKRELAGAKGAILTSVVAVRREDAAELRLETKQDFERLLRAHWAAHVESMGVAGPQDVRWVAAFHVNSEENYHVHVITWDASGRWNSLVAKPKLEQARQELVREATRPARQRVGRERTRARDELVARIRIDEPDGAHAKSLREIAGRLPSSGSLKYGSLARSDPELARAVDSLVDARIASDRSLASMLGSYERAVARHADMEGLAGHARAAYEAAAADDLRTRLGNAQIAQAKKVAGIDGTTCRDAPRRAHRPAPALRHGTDGDPALSPADRRLRDVVAQEVASCLPRADRAELAAAAACGRMPSPDAAARVASLPSVRLLATRCGVPHAGLGTRIARSVAAVPTATAGKKARDGDSGDEMARRAAKEVASRTVRAVAAAGRKPPGPRAQKQAARLAVGRKA